MGKEIKKYAEQINEMKLLNDHRIKRLKGDKDKLNRIRKSIIRDWAESSVDIELSRK